MSGALVHAEVVDIDVVGPPLKVSGSVELVHCAKVAADLGRTALHAPTADAYAIALATHIAGDIPKSLFNVVKYAPDIQRANVKYGDASQLRTDAIPIWFAAMEGLGAPVRHIVLGSGKVWTLDVTVDAWLVGPVPRSTLAAASS